MTGERVQEDEDRKRTVGGGAAGGEEAATGGRNGCRGREGERLAPAAGGGGQEEATGLSTTGPSSSPLDTALLSASLTKLKLSGAGLSHLPADLPPPDNIIELDVSRNNLVEVPKWYLCGLKNLRVLNLSANHLTKVPEALYSGLHMLKTLNLSGNRLITFQRAPLCLPLLQQLDLSDNKLVSPPPWLLDEGLSSCLEWLDLSGNPCFQLAISQQLHDSGLHLNKVSYSVRTLRLLNCGLRGVINEKYVVNFKNVVKLDLGNDLTDNKKKDLNFFNDAPSLPDQVTELSLSGTALAGINKTITSLPRLRKLDVSCNDLHWLPPTISGLKNLVLLRADSSKLYLLPSEMNLLSNLKELYLSCNELSSSDGFENLPSLEVLDLFGNQFITLPEFKNLTKLRALDFCQNFIDPPELIFLGSEVVHYTNLRNSLRTNFLRGKAVVRPSGAKAFPVLPEVDEDRRSNYSDSRESFNILDDTDEDNADNIRSKSENVENEVWEIDDDDNFEPCDYQDYRANYNHRMYELLTESAELMGQTSQEVRDHPHFYIPFRTASPGPEPVQLDPPEEGQFDDA